MFLDRGGYVILI